MFKKDTPSLSTPPKEDVVRLYRQAVATEVPLDTINQKIETYLTRTTVTETVEQLQNLERHRQAAKKSLPALAFRTVPIVLIAIGIFLVGNALWPIAQYYLFALPNLQANSLLSPIPNQQLADIVPKVVVAQAQTTTSEGGAEAEAAESYVPSYQPTIIDSELDYTNLANWFPTDVNLNSSNTPHIEYLIDVPTLNISNARVKLGGTNLDRSLIQYPGTAEPGQRGQAVVFGHSVLRQFYRPEEDNPKRYNSIFSKIMTMKTGEKIYVTVGNVKYTYAVKQKTVVKPEDTAILEQNYDIRGLKLVTCVPEGTIALRGIVTAELLEE